MTTELNYEEALTWIHSKLSFGIKPGLDRMRWMLQELGNPQEELQAIHVVGTNGKGSTVNYLQHIFTGAGYHVGTFTSPYIVDFKERISLDGQMISQKEFVRLVNEVAPVVERLPLETDLEPATEFEVITVLMFYYFGRMHPVDIAIIEAGLGGLHDSTNVFKPLALVCPSIGLDHQVILGDTHVAIAEQKVGALKEQVPFIYATDREDVQEVFEKRATQLNSPTFVLGREFTYRKKGDRFSFEMLPSGLTNFSKIAQRAITPSDEKGFTDLSLAMPGEHQLANASLAIMTSLLLKGTYPKLNATGIAEALSVSRWLGRTEYLRDNLMIDGAHNNESIAVLTALLKEQYAGRAIHMLFAAIDTKPVDEMLIQLESFTSLMVTTFPYPNSIKLNHYPESYQRVSSFEEWLNTVYDETSNDLYVVTGSLYFISQVRKHILKMPSN
ncbi:bifunctional folylpolyglutamate synthase/dihydrofolate synthase [Streptococcus fryi]